MITENLYELKNRIKKFFVLEKCKELINYLLSLVSLFSLLFLLIYLLETIGKFNTTFRTILFYLLLSAIIISFILITYKIIKFFITIKKINYIEIAKKIGNHFEHIKDELANVLQLKEQPDKLHSSQLVDAAFENVYIKTKDLNFNSIVDFSSTKKLLRITLILISVTLLPLIFIPELNFAFYRILNYNKNFSPPPKFYFEIYPGNKEITKGDNVLITIKTIGINPNEIFIATKYEDETDFINKKVLSDSSGTFHYEFTSVKNSFEYYAFAEGIKSDIYKISVLNRPVIKKLEVIIIPPAYSKISTTTQLDNGNINALKGSKVKLSIKSSHPLKNAMIVFDDTTSKQMRTNNDNASFEFNIYRDSKYKIIIQDEKGIPNDNPISYSIKIISDDYPVIELLSPEENIKINSDKISLVSRIQDDYGFSKLYLHYRISSSKYRQLAENYSSLALHFNKDKKEDEIYYTWDLSSLVLAEGEVVSYYLEVFDNDFVSGPKSSRTKIHTIQIPSIDELFAEAENSQENAIENLEKTLKEAEQLKDELQKISYDLKQNRREISWEEKERIEKSIDKFKNLMQKAEEISQKLAEMQNNLLQNNLLSEETLQKYNELQKILDEMTSDELKEAFKRLQETLQSLMRDNVQVSLEELKANEEYFKKSLERTINLLKRVQIEQKIDELLKRTEELTKKIEELKNKTEQSNLSDTARRNELVTRQEDITKGLNNLEEEMKKLDDKMKELKDLPLDQLEKALDEFEKQNNQELSREAEKYLQQMQKMNAITKQQQLSSNMSSMKSQFQNLQFAMQQMNQLRTYYDMMKILDDLLTLSDMQEKLKNETSKLNYNSNEFTKYSRKQNELQNNLSKILNKMTELSQKTFAITPEMGKALGKSFSEMQKSINSLQNRNGAVASQFQNKAMEYLNEAASLIKGGMEQMMSGGQGGGMMSLFQQLQQITKQQMNLNQLTQILNQGKLSQEMLSQLKRLAAEQEVIRKSLEQLNKEAQQAGKSKSLATNLEKILQDMKEVVTNLETEKINDELIKQQERILSRLLDAQRSINERDYEKQRKSVTGKDIKRTSPPDLILSKEERKNKLRDELQKAMREGYKKDYEDLIRKYFEALEKEK